MDSKEKEMKDEKDLICLMALNSEFDEVYDSSLSCSSNDDDIDHLYHELYNTLIKEKIDLKSKIAKNDVLINKIKQLEK